MHPEPQRAEVHRGLGYAIGPLLPRSVQPAWTVRSQRPSLTNVPSVIPYPTAAATNTFCVQTNKPNCILRACLIGVGAVTHHFDYGQRYIELMTRQASCAGGNIEVFPPPKAGVAPPGFYRKRPGRGASSCLTVL